MEALERGNNAKEALGVHEGAGDVDDRSPSRDDDDGSDGGVEEATILNDRLAALKRSLDQKVDPHDAASASNVTVVRSSLRFVVVPCAVSACRACE